MPFNLHKYKKNRLLRNLNDLNLRPQASLIEQLGGDKDWKISDEQFLLEIEMLLLQNVSIDAAKVSYSRFNQARGIALEANFTSASKLMNEYCTLYSIYIELLEANAAQ